jgi:hypothetical protein
MSKNKLSNSNPKNDKAVVMFKKGNLRFPNGIKVNGMLTIHIAANIEITGDIVCDYLNLNSLFSAMPLIVSTRFICKTASLRTVVLPSESFQDWIHNVIFVEKITLHYYMHHAVTTAIESSQEEENYSYLDKLGFKTDFDTYNHLIIRRKGDA